jgi:hypothetical protein
MGTRQITCKSCNLKDEASYFIANLQACPACNTSISAKRKQDTQMRVDRLRCTVQDLTQWEVK